ncbi:hypothetical protein Q4I30_002321 [Leishmania utingensis]|uniref:Uncharacterized protein n=1 Tax=Leishmania utingensis TaxID=653362 RepID=A0AAW3AT06_9TRYP
MEPGVHPQPHPNASFYSPYSQSTSSSQQYPQIRTDTTMVSSINSSCAADLGSKSASAAVAPSRSGSLYGGLRIATPHSPVTGTVHQPTPTQAQQSHTPHQRTSPKGMPSQHRFAMWNTSMTCSSSEDAGNLGLHRSFSTPNEAHGSQHQNSHGQHPQQHRQTKALPPSFERPSSELMDTISRSLNTHNDPELEGLPPMRPDDEDEDEDEDEMEGHPGGVVKAAGHATTLYSKGFLIATTSSIKDSPVSCGDGGDNPCILRHLHDGEEQQPPRDDGEASVSQTSQSRGPTASSSTGISHRLLTVEEINERRRASWVASHSVSQVHSAVACPAPGDARSEKRPGDPLKSAHSTNNLSTESGISKDSRPAHRQLTKEEADQLFAQCQQQRAAAAAKNITAPQQQQQHGLSSSLANAANNSNQSGVIHSSASDSTKPWLLSGDDSRAHCFHPTPTFRPPVTSANTVGSGGNTATKPMTFEWLRGTSGSGGASGTGFFAESTVHPWPGVNAWRDSNVAGSSSTVNVSAAMASCFGTTGVPAGDVGSSGDFKVSMGTLAGASQPPGGPSTSGFAWLPNTLSWTPQNQQQAQHQRTVFSFVPSAPPQVGPVSGATNAVTWGYSPIAVGLSGSGLPSSSHAYLPSLPAAAGLQGLSQERIEECIHHCDMQLVQLRQEREQLLRELQRRLYAAAADGEQQQQQHQHQHTHSASWPGALGPNAATISNSIVDIATARPAIPPRGAVTAGARAIGGGGSTFGQGPLWNCFGDLVVDGNVMTNAFPRGPGDTREPPGLCVDPIMEVDSEEWLGRTPTAAADYRQLSSSGSATTGGPAHQAAAGSRFTGERPGGLCRRRAEAGSQRNSSGGNSKNVVSSLAGVEATKSSAGGGGHSTNRCSHDNTPQEQKYLQTDPFSMYMHNKKLATTGGVAAPISSKASAAQ